MAWVRIYNFSSFFKLYWLPLLNAIIKFTPLFSQFSTHRSGEHGLAKLLDNIRDTGQTGLGGLHLNKQCIEPVGNLFLLGHWWQGEI